MKSNRAFFIYVLLSTTTCMSMTMDEQVELRNRTIGNSEATPEDHLLNKARSEADASLSPSSSKMESAVKKDISSASPSSGNYKIGGIEIPGGVKGAVATLIGGSALVGGAIVGGSKVVQKIKNWYGETQDMNQLKNDIMADISENEPAPEWRKDLANLMAQVAEKFPIILEIWKRHGALIKVDPLWLLSEMDFMDNLDVVQKKALYYVLGEFANYDLMNNQTRIVDKSEQEHLLVLLEDCLRLFDEVQYLEQLDEDQQRAVKELYTKHDERWEALKTALLMFTPGDASSPCEDVEDYSTGEFYGDTDSSFRYDNAESDATVAFRYGDLEDSLPEESDWGENTYFSYDGEESDATVGSDVDVDLDPKKEETST